MSWEEECRRCIKCGSCLSVCPIYLETGRETLVARGKLALLTGHFSDLLSADKEIYHLLSNCLLCGACAENCASGVKADELIQKGRCLFLEKAGPANWKKFLAREVLPHSGRLKSVRAGQKLLFKKIPEERGLRLRFSPDPRTWPELARPFFLDRNTKPADGQRGRSLKLGYFVGCTTNYLYPEVGEATVKLLSPIGEISLPAQQTCCGLPAFSLGDMKTARDLARKNILAFDEDNLEAIVVSCSSCATHIKMAYPELLAGETALQPKVENFIRKVEELSRFIAKRSSDLPLSHPPRPPQAVAFHDPCHAKRMLKITQEPRELLKSLPGLTLVELKGHRCCGHGGLFNLSHRDLSQKILEHPLTDLDNSGAEVIVTSCMACLMQFKLGVQRTGRKVKVKHWAELISAEK